ncbi:hypothetical protein KBB96_03930 [Luteolibacter ambystomatis]|uniref:Uncharacterized protein n=1 Tax=Luteolibacter ambystomatis TaxID=2824561 RepID=A0A975J106_9BACT|nr:hypothetical protein [Luteolibacter ambystomatis]QUE52042.1 hypothetical protein KBB96_03930 [Luteolibacter ambystomatis]
MKAGCACHGRSVLGFIRWALPGSVLVLMPKCPACFAAYVALASGIGLSIPAASIIRHALIALCLLSLAFLAVQRFRRLQSGKAV